MNYQRLFATIGVFGLLVVAVATAQHQRIVLMEDFSSVTCVNCPQAAEYVTKIAKENPSRIVTIQWHLDIPGRNDPFYQQNKPHNDARDAYYGKFNALPQVFVDGFGLGTGSTNEATIRSDVNSQLNEPSPIALTLTHVNDGGTYRVGVTANSNEGLGDGYRLYVAAVEGLVERPESYFSKSQPYYKETAFHDLFRTFVSPVEGVTVKLNPKQSQTFNYTYTLGDDWDPTKMYIVAWVQDEFTNEVVQAGFSPRTGATLTVTEPNPMGGYSLANIVPNPATENVRVNFTLGNVESSTITLHDAYGKLVSETDLGRVEEGEHGVELATEELVPGLYTVTLHAGEYRASRKLIVVK
ncbi:MAG: Omp28-related outer membrane protein [Ignavibacteriae bacterium]|nr:Omp28-related outer membrane protein [Ignavibacteriota bacterium]MCB9214301.1 Omp28-related outer membrane protein [Ignavibacteria bacterium]